jgi:tetratricopeptide (TPR) repeat protein
VAEVESHLGECLCALQRYAEAEPLLFYSYEALQRENSVPARVLREAHERLVKLYEAWGKADKAKEWRAKEVPLQDQRALRAKWTAEMQKERQKLYRLFQEKCPATAEQYNQLAWIMATAFDPKLRDPPMAVELARKAVDLDPNRGDCWKTLGAALYRAGEWNAVMEALRKANRINENGANYFLLAMAHWQEGDRDQARQWYDRAVQWMEKNKPGFEELRHIQAEATALLGIKNEPGKSALPPAKPSGQRD